MGTKVQITIGKITWYALLDLGVNVHAIPRVLYDSLNTEPMSPCHLNWYLANSSRKHQKS
jgi:hypothetical protein